MPKLREVLKWEKFWCRTALWESEHRWRLIYDKCQCECWVIKFVHHDHLIHWRTTNCWCKMYKVRSENGKRNKRHGMEWTIPYKKFMSAKARCINEKNPSYSRYWWRWIKFERKSFEDFWKDMGKSYKKHIKMFWIKNTTLDRIDVNWNYCKENCRWATWEEQMNNKTTNYRITYKWKKYTISQLARKKSIDKRTLRTKLIKWNTAEQAVEDILSHK